MQGKTRVGDTIRSMTAEAEAEMERAIAYMNDKVVPEVRRSSSAGLRLAAEQLQRMAAHLEGAPHREGAGGRGGVLGREEAAYRGSVQAAEGTDC